MWGYDYWSGILIFWAVWGRKNENLKNLLWIGLSKDSHTAQNNKPIKYTPLGIITHS